MAKGKTQGKGGKGAKKYGRKERKPAFQRYKVLGRFMDKLRRHVKKHPADAIAARALDDRENAITWVGWRTVRKQRRLGISVGEKAA
jgi:ribosomal protein S15P/S13E